ncbi:MAG: ABC transporter permease [Cyclobacteriaceae bacterium]
MSKKNIPPKLPLRFFRWFCDPDYVEDIEGDLLERFQKRTENGRNARRLYAMDILRLFRPGIIKKFEGSKKLNIYGMIKNDLKTSLSVIRREKLYSSINILGLTAGLVIALLILFYVKFEFSYEDHNPVADRVVRITMDYLDGETLVDQDCESYHVLGPMIKEEFPEVVDFTRAFGIDGTGIKVGNNHFRELVLYAVDNSFFEIFGYPLIYGNANTAMMQPDEVVLTRSTAIKYFGKVDVVGESVLMMPESTMKIVGVVEDSPANTHLKFGVLISYSSMKSELDKREDAWSSNDTFTYVKLSSPESYPVFTANLSALSDRLRAEDFIPDERIISQKIEDIHLYSDKSYEAEPNGEATIVFFLFGVALLVILIAIVNYINLSTAKSLDRAKEVGIRKVIGSSLFQLRVRFFVESFLINLLAGVATLLIIIVVFERFKLLAGLPESLQIYEDLFFWSVFAVLLVVSTVLSGSFPAFVLSSFQPVAVLKGKFSNSSRGVLLRKTLVVSQFAIATFLLIQTFAAKEQLTFMQQTDLGMNTKQVVVIHTPPTQKQMESYTPFKEQLLAHSSFSNASLSTSVPGMPTSDMGSTTNIGLVGDLKEPKNNFFRYTIDSSFVETMEMELVAGQNFSSQNDIEYPIIVNEQALIQWGIPLAEDLVGRSVRFWGREHQVVGVVKDFHQTGVKDPHIPLIFSYADRYGDYVSIRTSEGDLLKQMEDLEEIYSAHFPNSPFEFFFLDQEFDAHYAADRRFQLVFGVLSMFAILITCLGLFGLASFTVAKRAKEIGIRKVLGASVSQIIRLLSRDFVALVVISSILALPVTYFLVQNWLDQYAFRIELSIWLFLIPTILVLAVAFVTVFSRTFKISNANPVNSLRDE